MFKLLNSLCTRSLVEELTDCRGTCSEAEQWLASSLADSLDEETENSESCFSVGNMTPLKELVDIVTLTNVDDHYIFLAFRDPSDQMAKKESS